MKQIENIRAKVFPPLQELQSQNYICGIKWDGWGVKGEGIGIDEAVESAVQAFYAWLNANAA